jgi:Mn2+/Fe2+ NRAMP family transporter
LGAYLVRRFGLMLMTLFGISVLIFVLLLINRRDLMGDHVNTWGFNVVAWTASIVVIVITLVLVWVSIFNPSAAGLGSG